MTRKCLLILGGSMDQLFMLRTAKEMGLETAVVDGNPSAPGIAAADHGAAIDFSRVEEVVAHVRRLRGDGVDVAGVCTMGSDVPHLLAAIGGAFGWQVPTPETARLATDKHAMKVAFEQAGVAVPAFSRAASAEEAGDLWSRWGCRRIVVKPTDRAGSRGVRALRERREVAPAFEHARASSLRGEVIVEEYLEGPQISTESILWDGRVATPGYADRVYRGMDSFLPQIIENGGWVPCSVGGSRREEVKGLVERAAAALGVRRGVAKGDVVYHPERGAVMIEMAARLSGGDFSESLVPLGSGVNYVRAAIDIALGREPEWASLEPAFEKVVVNRYFFAPPGRLEAIEGVEAAARRPGLQKLELWKKPGDAIARIESHGQRLGVFVLAGETRSAVRAAIEEVYDTVRFRIDGAWHTGAPPGFLEAARDE